MVSVHTVLFIDGRRPLRGLNTIAAASGENVNR
jgi:hypothetical protein